MTKHQSHAQSHKHYPPKHTTQIPTNTTNPRSIPSPFQKCLNCTNSTQTHHTNSKQTHLTNSKQRTVGYSEFIPSTVRFHCESSTRRCGAARNCTIHAGGGDEHIPAGPSMTSTNQVSKLTIPPNCITEPSSKIRTKIYTNFRSFFN